MRLLNVCIEYEVYIFYRSEDTKRGVPTFQDSSRNPTHAPFGVIFHLHAKIFIQCVSVRNLESVALSIQMLSYLILSSSTSANSIVE